MANSLGGIKRRDPVHYQCFRRLTAAPVGQWMTNAEFWGAEYKTSYNKRNAREYRRIDKNWPGSVEVELKATDRCPDGEIVAWRLNWSLVGEGTPSDINRLYKLKAGL